LRSTGQIGYDTEKDGLSPLVAFTGGLASLLLHCSLPLMPVYIASRSGPEIGEGNARELPENRRFPKQGGH